MPRFVNEKRACHVSTSYKVMYTSLLLQARESDLVEIGEGAAAARRARTRSWPHLLFVRDPIDRVVSAWRDKFRAQPKAYGTPEFVGWQPSQDIVLKRLGQGHLIDEDRAEALLAVGFGPFVDLLPYIYFRDGHYRPQVALSWYRLRGVIPITPSDFTLIARIESPPYDQIIERYGINLAIRVNTTDHIERPAIDANQARILRRIYRKDFERFGYRPP